MQVIQLVYEPTTESVRAESFPPSGRAGTSAGDPGASGSLDGRPVMLAIGDFDGVHLGHREVIARARDTAGRLDRAVAVMTFHPHPREVLGVPGYSRCLTPLAEKLEQFRALAVDRVYVVRFDPAFARLSPQAFVESVLLPLGVDTVVVGFDFTFGHMGAATPDTLCELARGRFAVEIVRPYHLDGRKVSSTLIRECLQTGDVRRAQALLGRPYALSGIVVEGERRGRTIGSPTANLRVDDPYVIPAGGVYAVRVSIDGNRRDAVMNIGTKPTFHAGAAELTLEAHLLDFAGSLYGRTLRVEFVDYLRPERRFASVRELVEQIGRDVEDARARLGNAASANIGQVTHAAKTSPRPGD